MSDKLFYQGHVYVNVGKSPCPLKGCEDGMIATSDVNGIPAWWTDGCLFVLDLEQSVETKSNAWVLEVPA